MKTAWQVATEIAKVDGVDVEEVLSVGAAVLAGLDTRQRRILASVLRAPEPMKAAALANVGRTIERARADLSRHAELSARWQRRQTKENGNTW
jgi:hypothetical protein